MKHEDVVPVSKENAEKTFASDVPEDIVRALLGLTLHDADWEWVQDRCLTLLDSRWAEVRNTAILCLGHLARIHKKLHKSKVIAALSKKLADPEASSRAEDALEDIEMFAA
jgi:hypothetical protein